MTKKEKQIIGNKAKAVFEEWSRWGDYTEKYREDVERQGSFKHGQRMTAKYSFAFDILVSIMESLGMLDDFNNSKSGQ